MEILKELVIFGKWFLILTAGLIIVLLFWAIIDYIKTSRELRKTGDLTGYAIEVNDEYVIWRRTAREAMDDWLEIADEGTQFNVIPMTKKVFERLKNGEK